MKAIEWWLIKELVKEYCTQSESNLINKSMFERVQLGKLIELSIRNRILPLVSYQISKDRGNDLGLKGLIVSFFQNQYDLNKYRVGVYTQEIQRLGQALDQAKIVYFVRKGVLFSKTLYLQSPVRYFRDLDIGIMKEDIAEAERVFKKMGFQKGVRYKIEKSKNIPIDREDQLMFKLSPDHLVPHTKVVSDEFVSHIELDVSLSLGWKNSPFDYCNSCFSKNRFDVLDKDDSKLFSAMCIELQFIDVVIHLFKDSYLVRLAKQDDRLSKFVDVYLLLRLNNNKIFCNQFIELITNINNNILPPILWVLYHLDSLFETTYMQEFLKYCGKIIDINELNQKKYFFSYQKNNREIGYWSGSFDERLSMFNFSNLILD